MSSNTDDQSASSGGASALTPGTDAQRAIFFHFSEGQSRRHWGGDATAIASSRGTLRTENQDRVALINFESAAGPALCLVVCDGMGGMLEGARAAELCLSSFAARLSERAFDSLEAQLADAISVANTSVFAHLRGRGGSTICALVIEFGSAPLVGWVGDTRAYGITKGGLCRQLTKDDSLAEVKRAVAQMSVPSETDHQLVQFVGMGRDLEPNVIRAPQSEWLVLSSDGAYCLGPAVLASAAKLATTAEQLSRAIVAWAEILDGKDNATVAVVAPSKVSWTAVENFCVTSLFGRVVSIRQSRPPVPQLSRLANGSLRPKSRPKSKRKKPADKAAFVRASDPLLFKFEDQDEK